MGEQSASAGRGAIVLPAALYVLVHMHTVQEQLGLLIAAIAANCCGGPRRSCPGDEEDCAYVLTVVLQACVLCVRRVKSATRTVIATV